MSFIKSVSSAIPPLNRLKSNNKRLGLVFKAKAPISVFVDVVPVTINPERDNTPVRASKRKLFDSAIRTVFDMIQVNLSENYNFNIKVFSNIFGKNICKTVDRLWGKDSIYGFVPHYFLVEKRYTNGYAEKF